MKTAGPSLENARAYYDAERVAKYDAKRDHKRKWRLENECLASMLRGSTGRVLDVPVGTGRFLQLYYDLGLEVTGLDSSPAMIEAAKRAPGNLGAFLFLGDVTKIDYPVDHFDTVVCVRLLHLINPAELSTVMAELVRVARRQVIVTAYLADKPYADGRQQTHTRQSLFPPKGVNWHVANCVKLLTQPKMGEYYMIKFERHDAVG